MQLDQITWEDFEKLNIEEKGECFSSDGRVHHALVAQQFSREKLESLGDLATKIRMIAKSEEGMTFLMQLLAHRRAMLYFTQPSTRTFLSFRSACQILGMRSGDVRDASTSSEFKGESQEDSVRTFSSYFDLIIMRTKKQGLAERMAWALSHSERPVPIINAGSGKDQHPTQALLDIYTLQRSFQNRGGIDGKTVVFVGDLARGRTVRSLAMLLTKYSGVKMLFVAPEQLQVGEDVQELLNESGNEYELSGDFDGAVPQADAIYMTRIQDEWDDDESNKIDISSFSFTVDHLKSLKQDGILMHPLPRRGEIAKEVDHDPRAMYWRQMRNGMWIRSALIANIFGRDQDIHDYYEKTLAS
jgi:aspartate carbamoyltransferase catalytic subunit